jgi:hypothetical protein
VRSPSSRWLPAIAFISSRTSWAWAFQHFSNSTRCITASLVWRKPGWQEWSTTVLQLTYQVWPLGRKQLWDKRSLIKQPQICCWVALAGTNGQTSSNRVNFSAVLKLFVFLHRNVDKEEINLYKPHLKEHGEILPNKSRSYRPPCFHQMCLAQSCLQKDCLVHKNPG